MWAEEQQNIAIATMMQPPENKIGTGATDNSKAIAKKTNQVFTFKERLDILTGDDTTTVVSPNTVKGWDIFQVRAAVNLEYGENVQLVSAISFSWSQLLATGRGYDIISQHIVLLLLMKRGVTKKNKYDRKLKG